MTRIGRGVATIVVLASMFLITLTLTEAQGIGVGVKGGFLHSSFDVTEAFESGGGWQVGLFFGGNRPGTVGFMGEFNVQARKAGDETIYYFQVPALLRLNFGSSGTGARSAIVYGIVGPSLDLKFSDSLEASIDAIESADVSIVGGIGFEISRFIIEGRGTWGFRNIATASTVDVKTTTFAILGGLRFN